MGGLGILGGTFNPPHNGHLASARHASRELALERVLLVPTGIPPHKQIGDEPGAERRLEMCRLAADGDERLSACSIEVGRQGPSYTVDTLRAIHASDPGVDLTFIMGADMARTVPEWHEPEELLALARLAVAEREGTAREEILEVLRPLGGDGRVVFLEMPSVDVSSSMVREHVASGRPIDDLVPEAVATYIGLHGLYQRPGQGATHSQSPEVMRR